MVKVMGNCLSFSIFDAHKAIADQSTVVLTDGKTGDNVANTVAQAIAISSTLNTKV